MHSLPGTGNLNDISAEAYLRHIMIVIALAFNIDHACYGDPADSFSGRITL